MDIERWCNVTAFAVCFSYELSGRIDKLWTTQKFRYVAALVSGIICRLLLVLRDSGTRFRCRSWKRSCVSLIVKRSPTATRSSSSMAPRRKRLKCGWNSLQTTTPAVHSYNHRGCSFASRGQSINQSTFIDRGRGSFRSTTTSITRRTV